MISRNIDIAEAKAVAGSERTAYEKAMIEAEREMYERERDDGTKERGDGMPVGSPPPEVL